MAVTKMRVIAGKLRGRHLHSVPGLRVRPSGDRLKESLFNILAPHLPGARFLDLFAGTGAIGIEALSRGTSGVVFVEQDLRARECLMRNLSDCRLSEGFRILGLSVSTALRRLSTSEEVFDLVFLDPPYQGNLYETTLEAVGSGKLLAAGSWVVAEHPRSLVLGADYGCLQQFRVRWIGDSGLTFFKRAPSD